MFVEIGTDNLMRASGREIGRVVFHSGELAIAGTFFFNSYGYISEQIRPVCYMCKSKLLFGGGTIHAHGMSGFYGGYCFSCANFNWQEDFNGRDKWIKESVPSHVSGYPNYALADWLEENGRKADADYLRTFRSGT